jgi:hypothetical protein
MAAKGLILVMEEGSGRILAARLAPVPRADYEFEQLTDYFQLGAAEETIPLVKISQTFAIRLKRTARDPKFQADQNVTLPVFSSSPPLP